MSLNTVKLWKVKQVEIESTSNTYFWIKSKGQAKYKGKFKRKLMIVKGKLNQASLTISGILLTEHRQQDLNDKIFFVQKILVKCI